MSSVTSAGVVVAAAAAVVAPRVAMFTTVSVAVAVMAWASG